MTNMRSWGVNAIDLSPLLMDDSKDAGARAMHGAVAKRVGVRKNKISWMGEGCFVSIILIVMGTLSLCPSYKLSKLFHVCA